MFSDWHSNVAFHTGGVQATCAINSSPYFQNLLSSTLALRVSFKTKQPPQSCLLCIQPKSQKSTLTLSLHHCRPCLQWCSVLPIPMVQVAEGEEWASTRSTTLTMEWFSKIHEIQGAPNDDPMMIRKQGSLACFRWTLHCPTLLAMFLMFIGVSDVCF